VPTVEDRYHVDVRLLVAGARVHAVNAESGSCVLLCVGRRRIRPGTGGVLHHRGLPVGVEEAVEPGRTLALAEPSRPARAARARRWRPLAGALGVVAAAIVAGQLARGGPAGDARANVAIPPVAIMATTGDAVAPATPVAPVAPPRPRRRPPPRARTHHPAGRHPGSRSRPVQHPPRPPAPASSEPLPAL
jgi:hypothetical protein